MVAPPEGRVLSHALNDNGVAAYDFHRFFTATFSLIHRQKNVFVNQRLPVRLSPFDHVASNGID